MVNDILAAFTILSVISIVLETVPAFVHLKPLFDTVEYTTVAVFTLEYFARMYAAPRKRDYIFGFFGIIDLLAIAPTYLTLANFTFLKTARVLRILRFLRAIRLAKIAELRTFSEVENNEFPDFYKYSKPLEMGLWVLWVAKEKLNIRKMTSEQIALIIIIIILAFASYENLVKAKFI